MNYQYTFSHKEGDMWLDIIAGTRAAAWSRLTKLVKNPSDWQFKMRE